MKKILTLVLAMLMVLSMAACGTDADNQATTPDSGKETVENNSQASDNTTTNKENESENDLLPELLPDGEYSVNLDQEKVIYDNEGIKITYTGMAFNVGLCDEVYFKVENNTDNYICFLPDSVVWNGISFSASNSTPTAAHTTEVVTVLAALSSEREKLISSKEEIMCFDITFSILGEANEYGTSGTPVANGVTFVFTEGQHDHRNDNRILNGELIFENEEVALYVENKFVKKGDKFYSSFAIINKTNEPISFSGRAECRYVVAPVTPHYAMVEGMSAQLSANSYFTGVFCFKDEHDTLEMNEIIFILSGYKATNMDYVIALDYEDFAKCNFDEERVSIVDFTLEK